MKLTERDRQLTILLPALALIIGYLMTIETAPAGRIKQLSQQINQARQTSPAPFEIAEYEQRATHAVQELAAVEAEAGKTRPALDVLRRPVTGRAAEQVAALLPRHHLALVEQSELETMPKDIAPVLQRLAAQFGTAKGSDDPAFWRVKFVGTYGDVVAALDELAAADSRVIPANLTMADGPQPGIKTWTLVLWM